MAEAWGAGREVSRQRRAEDSCFSVICWQVGNQAFPATFFHANLSDWGLNLSAKQLLLFPFQREVH